MSEDDKKEGLFNRLKNIESKNEDQSKKQLDAIKNINISSKPLKAIGFFSTLSHEAKRLMVNIKELDDWLDTAKLVQKLMEKQNMTLAILHFHQNLLPEFIIKILCYKEQKIIKKNWKY